MFGHVSAGRKHFNFRLYVKDSLRFLMILVICSKPSLRAVPDCLTLVYVRSANLTRRFDSRVGTYLGLYGILHCPDAVERNPSGEPERGNCRV